MPIPPPGARGPRRARQDDAVIAELIDEARAAAAEVETHRASLAWAAERRRTAVRKLYAAGLSVRAIAEALDVSAGTVQGLLRG